VKFDYKPKMPQMGSPIYKRALHVTLGVAIATCVALAISFGKSTAQLSIDDSDKGKILSVTESDLKVPYSLSTSITSIPTTTIGPMASAKTETLVKQVDIIARAIKESELKAENKVTETLHTIKIRSGDTLSKICDRLGISNKGIHEILTASSASRKLASLQLGQTLKLRVTKDQQIAELSLEVIPGQFLQISKLKTGFHVEQKIQPLEKQLAFGKGQIRDSLFSSAKRAGLNHKLIAQMVEIFGWDIDFTLDLQPNDTFRVLYEEKYLDGQRIETGNILAAEIINNGEKHLAIRYTDKSGRTGYFSPEGYGMYQAFLRSPVNYTRISSHFGARCHPVLHKMRQHKGVDYSAPHGTPVQATSQGKIIFAGTRGGYGKVIEIQHGARYSTLYAHLSRFPKGLRIGTEVKQGQIIGFVGRTGLATGDHLHYEFRINGIHHNPLTAQLPKKAPISDTHKLHFLAHSKEMLRLLDLHDHKLKMAINNFSIHE
jgi:murein DD-endopeptidase MepM/ murein hydrolase activator NlpD